jgi:hypothetical protein
MPTFRCCTTKMQAIISANDSMFFFASCWTVKFDDAIGSANSNRSVLQTAFAFISGMGKEIVEISATFERKLVTHQYSNNMHDIFDILSSVLYFYSCFPS